MSEGYNRYSGTQKINPDSYLDMAIKSIIALPNELMEKEASFDINKYLRMKVLLTEQLENLAVGLNVINTPKQEYELENITDIQKELREAIINYYRKVFPEIGNGAVIKADMVMCFMIEGNYYSGIKLRTEELNKQVEEGKVSEEIANSQKANLKLQLILKAIKNKKVKALEISV